jgi:hypothetical protein
MSIDQRLRSGLHAGDSDPVDPTRLVEGWADVVTRAETQRSHDHVRWGMASVAAAVLVVAAAVTWWPRIATSPEPLPPVPSPTSSVEPLPLEGTWSAGPIPAQAVVDHLESVGLGQWADGALAGAPRDAAIEYQLKLQGGRLTMARAVDDAASDIQDVEGYEVSGDRVTFTPQTSTCSTTFDWQVRGGRLRLHPVSDSCPPYRGTPDIAFMEALYGAVAFTR